MRLTRNPGENSETAARVEGVLKEFHVDITTFDRKPFYKIKLEGDNKDYNFYSGGWVRLKPGTPVALHSFKGFEKSHDDGDNYYLDGVEVLDESDRVVVEIVRSVNMVFED